MPCDEKSGHSDIMDWSTGHGMGHYANVRFGSGSSEASQSSGDICRICHCESDPQNPLLTPCYCSGSLKYVHQSCLQQWLTASETNSCELCKFPFIMHSKIKPINEWRSPDISGYERRRLCCKAIFQSAAALCVIWSLCVLIERLAEDVHNGAITDWPFWTKLAVVTVGLMGGMVFLYIQCKSYMEVINKWKARNRILLIQNAPEKIHPRAQTASASAPRNKRPNDQIISIPFANAAAAADIINGVNNGIGLHHPRSSGAAVANDNAPALAALAAAATGMQHNQLELNSKMQHNQFGNVMNAELSRLSSESAAQLQTQHNVPYYNQQQLQQLQSQQQVAVAANIECGQSQHNYERDWALDDVVSQISSFRPCPQGSGSMIPFHDTLSHNILENSENSSRGSLVSRQDLSTGGISSDTGREHAMQLSSFSGSGEQKAPSISSGVSHAVANGLGGFAYRTNTHKRLSNSSIYNAQRDVLTDAVATTVEPDSFDFSTHPKIDYRHSSMLTESVDCDEFLGANIRRYSDTKLLEGNNTEDDSIDGVIIDAPMENEPMLYGSHTQTENSTNMRLRQLLLQTQNGSMLDMELPTSPLSPPAAYASGGCQSKPTLRRSFDTSEVFADPLHFTLKGPNTTGETVTTAVDHSRINYASLPNLNSSCESLINPIKRCT